MTTSQGSQQETARPYLRQGTIRFLAAAVLSLGVLWAIGSLAYLINGITQTSADVEIQVELTEQVRADLADDVRQTIVDPSLSQDGVVVQADPGGIELAVWDSTALEQLLARGGGFIGGLAGLVGALLAYPIVQSVAQGEPFRAGNARRLGLLAILVPVAQLLAAIPSRLAAGTVLGRVGLDGPDSPVTVPNLELPFAGLVVGVGLLLLAEAFRRGSILVADADGLV